MINADPDLVKRHLEKVLRSAPFEKSETGRKLLTYLVQRSLSGEAPKEAEVAIDAFGRDTSFNGAEDSLVRVGVRTLRQKLTEYYLGPGLHDELQLLIPKGGYKVHADRRVQAATSAAAASSATLSPAVAPDSVAAADGLAGSPRAGARPLRWGTPRAGLIGMAAVLLAISLIANLYLWTHWTPEDPGEARVRESPVWADLNASSRTLTIVLGDLFMYTQVDAQTGRTVTVRDSEINSSEELRALLASNPSFAANRGQRYTTLISKSAAVGMASILPIVARPGRQVEVRILDELQAEDIRNNDIVFIGPLVRLGPLAGHYLLRSRYRYDGEQQSLIDTISRKAFAPEGDLAKQRTDYGLAAKFTGPTGNHIIVFTSVGRNAGLLQIVRTLTSAEGLAAFEAKLRSQPANSPAAFEALLSVTGFKRTDLTAEVVEIHPLLRVMKDHTQRVSMSAPQTTHPMP